MKKTQNIALNLLKIFTMFLIINSHADILYPSRIRFFASGGAIGNELFFLISGYLFNVKEDKYKDIWKRYIKLYIPVYFMTVLYYLVRYSKRMIINNIYTLLRVWIWPTHFWFLSALFGFCIILYGLCAFRIERTNRFIKFAVFVWTVDMICYMCIISKETWIIEDCVIGILPIHFKCIYSLFVFVLGYYLKMNRERVLSKVNFKNMICLAGISFFVFYIFKIMLNKNLIMMSFQIISQPLTVFCAFFIFLLFITIDLNRKFKGTKIEGCINIISNLSLESYLVQFLIIEEVALLPIPFPVNLILCFIIVLICAWILNLFDTWLNTKILDIARK